MKTVTPGWERNGKSGGGSLLLPKSQPAPQHLNSPTRPSSNSPVPPPPESRRLFPLATHRPRTLICWKPSRARNRGRSYYRFSPIPPNLARPGAGTQPGQPSCPGVFAFPTPPKKQIFSSGKRQFRGQTSPWKEGLPAPRLPFWRLKRRSI